MSDLVSTAARFSGRVADYAKYRPSYPSEAIDAILAGLPDVPELTIVDIGAGTGIATRLFAARGARVIGIEPNPEMREAALATGLDVRHATADHTGLADRSVDIVAAFQAFHWFATPSAIEEFSRILRPGGRVALVWNVRDDADAFTKAYGETADLDSAPAQRAGNAADDPDLASLFRDRGFSDVRVRDFPSAQHLDLDGLIGRARSASYIPQEGREYEAIAARLRELYAQHRNQAELVTLVYRTNVYLTDRC